MHSLSRDVTKKIHMIEFVAGNIVFPSFHSVQFAFFKKLFFECLILVIVLSTIQYK